jgi:AraC-like DNA-binding protein
MHRQMDDSSIKMCLPWTQQMGLLASSPDVLTDILEEVQLRSFVAGRSTLISPWNVRVPEGDGAFYAITEGSCWLEADGLPQPLRLEAGDLVVLPHGRSHQLRDALGRPGRPATGGASGGSIVAQPAAYQPARPRNGAMGAVGAMNHSAAHFGGAVTKLVCGCLIFHRRGASPLLGALPPVIHVRGQGHNSAWLTDTLRLIARESAEHLPGAQTVINRLAYILFVQAVRAYVAALPPDAPNWMRALRDPAIGKALGMMHAKPDVNWSVASLAEEVAMSRSVFAAQFCQLVGEPPLQYLTALRMRKARDLLRDKSVAITEVAGRVGYGSEASFGNAFKRWWGTAPGAYRRRAESANCNGSDAKCQGAAIKEADKKEGQQSEAAQTG